jgi:YidC/Oxa1 family membrane protein insertase
MGIVLFSMQFFLPKQAPNKKAEAAKVETKAPAPAPPAEEAKPAPVQQAAAKKSPKGKAPATQAETLQAAGPETVTLENDRYLVRFDNRGAVVTSWILKGYKNGAGKQLNLVNGAAPDKTGWAFTYWSFPGTKPTADLNQVPFRISKSPDGLGVTFEFSDGNTSARKSFRFEPGKFLVRLTSDVTVAGTSVPHLLSWRGGFGDQTVHNAADTQHSVRYEAGKLSTEAASAASKGPLRVSGSYDFAGLADTFFAGVLLPEPGTALQFVTLEDKFKPSSDAEEKAHVGVAFGEAGALDMLLFAGPKSTAVLEATHPRLQTLIDWGWFWFIAKPLFSALSWTESNVTFNWGWAIVLVTVVINLALLPLRFSQLKSSQKMAVIQPQVQAIQAKYKNVSMKDPRKQQQNEELMELYKKHGINPMGGCVPLILQMPFFIAFFKVLSVSIELRGASWLWIGDLSQPEVSFIKILPLTMLVTQILMQKMTPAAGGDPSQQRMMMIMMPIMLTLMFYTASSGLVLYWLTGNVVGIVQQYFFNRIAMKAAPAQTHSSKK